MIAPDDNHGAGRNPAPIPVTVIGGFLGAGKTTLLNHVLSQDHGVRAAVLVNDFGAINIDAKLVVGMKDDTINLANGCICCTIRGDLVQACLDLLQRPERPEHLLIELSGASDPGPVLNTFLEPEFANVFTLNSALIVVDAELLPGLTGKMADLALTQLQAADIVALNKTDLVARDGLDRLKTRIGQLVPGARMLEVTHGRVPLDLIFEHAPHATGAGAANDHDHDCEAQGCGHDHSHTPGHALASMHWTSELPLSLPKLRATLEALPDAILRCKGILHIEEMPGYRYVLQMVGRRYTLDETGPWGNEISRSEIVLIGAERGFDEDGLQQQFESCIGAGDESQSPVLRLARKLNLAI